MQCFLKERFIVLILFLCTDMKIAKVKIGLLKKL